MRPYRPESLSNNEEDFTTITFVSFAILTRAGEIAHVSSSLALPESLQTRQQSKRI